MKQRQPFRRALAVASSAALLLSVLAAPVRAEEETEPPATAQFQETEPPVTTQPQETEPPATTQPAQETEPPATTQPPQETEPPVTTQPTQETEPAETKPPEQVRQTLMTVAAAKNSPEGTGGIVIKGTIVHADHGITVLQDSKAGILLTLPEGITAALKDQVKVVGTRSTTGLTVETLEKTGSAALPEKEGSLTNREECIRICLREVTYGDGMLIQDMEDIRIVPQQPEGIQRGELVNAWGVIVENRFYADKVEPVSRAPEPAPLVKAIPDNGQLLPGENIRLHCDGEDAAIFYALSQDGITFGAFTPYTGEIKVEETVQTLYLRAYAQRDGGEPGETTDFGFSRQTPEGDADTPWNFYFGQLHAHTGLAQADSTPEEAFAYAQAVEGLDFFGITVHSDGLENAAQGSLGLDGSTVSPEWAAGKQAAAAVTDGDFVGLFGFEMNWQNKAKGHINTFHTPGWQYRGEEDTAPSLEAYYDTLLTQPSSVSQFNHPGLEHGDFSGFAHYDPKYDTVLQLLEVGSGKGLTALDAYITALDQGWHVAPTNNDSDCEGRWGDASPARTVVLAQTLTEESLYEAMSSRRVYAAQDRDLEIFYCLNGAPMGSVLQEEAREITVTLRDPTDAIGTLEVAGSGGAVVKRMTVEDNQKTLTIPVSGDQPYYFLKILRGDTLAAVTAPVWLDTTVDAGITSFTANTLTPMQGEEVVLSLNLFNNEAISFPLGSVTITAGGETVYQGENLHSIDAYGREEIQYTLPYDGLGALEVQAVVTGTLYDQECRYEQTLTLTYQAPEAEEAPISQVRSGTQKKVYRVNGYVTAGTSNANTTFPNMVYLQDDSGGIGILGFTASGIQIGTPLAVTGYLETVEENPVLVYIRHELLDQDHHRYVPETQPLKTAMDYAQNGGRLVQVEAQVLSFSRTEAGNGVARFTLIDENSDTAVVVIDPAITSGATGENTLLSQIKYGNRVRAIGILHKEADGTVVLRVRDCDEVVYVPAVKTKPIADPTNPKTGDWIWLPGTGMALSGLGLLRLRKRK